MREPPQTLGHTPPNLGSRHLAPFAHVRQVHVLGKQKTAPRSRSGLGECLGLRALHALWQHSERDCSSFIACMNLSHIAQDGDLPMGIARAHTVVCRDVMSNCVAGEGVWSRSVLAAESTAHQRKRKRASPAPITRHNACLEVDTCTCNRGGSHVCLSALAMTSPARNSIQRSLGALLAHAHRQLLTQRKPHYLGLSTRWFALRAVADTQAIAQSWK